MNKRIQTAALAAAAIVLSGGGFVAGITVGPSVAKSDGTTSASSDKAAAGAQGAAGQGRRQVITGPGGAGGQQLSGRVISVNDGSITVETREPGGDTTRSTIALVGESTRVVKTTETDIKLGDINPGDQVLIVGAPDAATGTVSANAVVVGVNAIQQVFGGPGGAGQAGARPGGAAQRPGASPSPRP